MSGILTDVENSILIENDAYRKKILDEAFKGNNIPSGPKEIEAINAVLTSRDKSVYDAVGMRLKHQENQNKGAMLAAVSEALRNISLAKQPVVEKAVDLTELEFPIDAVEGETEVEGKKFTLNEILNVEG